MGELVRLPLGPVNVRLFGATGNGVTNDTAAINAAIAAAIANTSNTIYAPAGTYLVDTILFAEGFTIVGDEGRDSTASTAGVNVNSGPTTIFKSRLKATVFLLTGVANHFGGTCFRNIKVDGNDPTFTGIGIGIHLGEEGSESGDVNFNNVVIENCGHEGFLQGPLSYDPGIQYKAWAHSWDRFAVRNCGRDLIRYSHAGTVLSFSNFIVQHPPLNGWCFRIYGTSYTAVHFRSGGGPDHAAGQNYGSILKAEGNKCGKYIMDHMNWEGWTGVGFEVGNGCYISQRGCFFADTHNNGLQVAMRFVGTSADWVHELHDTVFDSTNWLNGHPMAMAVGAAVPPILFYAAVDNALTVKYEGDASFFTIRPILSVPISASIAPRFTHVRIDRQFQLNLIQPHTATPVGMWIDDLSGSPLTGVNYSTAADGTAYANGQTVLPLASTTVALYRRIAGAFKAVPYQTKVDADIAAAIAAIPASSVDIWVGLAAYFDPTDVRSMSITTGEGSPPANDTLFASMFSTAGIPTHRADTVVLAPTYIRSGLDGLPMITYNGTAQLLQTTVNALSRFTLIAVYDTYPTSGAGGFFTTGTSNSLYFADGSFSPDTNNVSLINFTGGALLSTSKCLIATFDYDNDSYTVYLNGVARGTSTVTNGVAPTGVFRLGRSQPGEQPNGSRVAAYFIFDRTGLSVHTASQVTAIYAVLKRKWPTLP